MMFSVVCQCFVVVAFYEEGGQDTQDAQKSCFLTVGKGRLHFLVSLTISKYSPINLGRTDVYHLGLGQTSSFLSLFVHRPDQSSVFYIGVEETWANGDATRRTPESLSLHIKVLGNSLFYCVYLR